MQAIWLWLQAQGMISDNSQFTQMISLFSAQLPVLIISLLGCVVIMARKNDLGSATLWALAGFGLSILLCVVFPIVQTIVQKWVVEGGSLAQRASIFTILAVVWSILRAVSLAFLLAAIVGGRQRTAV